MFVSFSKLLIEFINKGMIYRLILFRKCDRLYKDKIVALCGERVKKHENKLQKTAASHGGQKYITD